MPINIFLEGTMPETITVTSERKEELIDITEKISKTIADSDTKKGLCFLFTPHTTAAITINENADPDVTRDIIYGLKKIVPENGYHHREGNSSAHIKSSMIGCSQDIIIENSKLLLGTWQGIYFCEFDGPRSRKVFVEIMKT